ncbi:MAG: hypothetical protein LIO62_04625 [Clostridiales bacterium]|nr:hypothetical protein [Clostridiales bacterium]
MQIYSKSDLAQKAHELGVVRDTLEKVLRLQEVLRFFSSSKLLKTSFALKKFKSGVYCPELVFSEEEIVSKLKNYPMARWKIQRILDKSER